MGKRVKYSDLVFMNFLLCLIFYSLVINLREFGKGYFHIRQFF
nr:MAG TPA: hypothetical protein [Caudoviricetes sp.]